MTLPNFDEFVQTACKQKNITLTYGDTTFDYSNGILKISGAPSKHWMTVCKLMRDKLGSLKIHIDIGTYDYYYLSSCVPSGTDIISLIVDKDFSPDALSFMELYECKSLIIKRMSDCIYSKEEIIHLTDIPITGTD